MASTLSHERPYVGIKGENPTRWAVCFPDGSAFETGFGLAGEKMAELIVQLFANQNVEVVSHIYLDGKKIGTDVQVHLAPG